MILYVVFAHIDDGELDFTRETGPLGVFSTKEKALKYISDLESSTLITDSPRGTYVTPVYEEFILDSEQV